MRKILIIIWVLLSASIINSCDKKEQDGMFEEKNDLQGIYIISKYHNNNINTNQLINTSKALNAYSIAKLFTTLAVGICIDQELLKLDDKLVELLEITLKEQNDPKWNNVTVDMLLKHEAGFEQSLLDIDVDDISSYNTTNYLEYVLSHSLNNQGKESVYTDAAYYLLSLIIEKVTNQTLYDFFLPILMIDLNFNEYAWSSCPNGHTMGGTGLYIRCEDMIKVGIMLLNNGNYNGKQIISRTWCKQMITNNYSLDEYDNGWYGKSGMYGQFLGFNQEQGMVIAWFAHSDNIDYNYVLNKMS